MRFVVDQFAESLQTNATNPPAAAGVPLHYLAKGLAKPLETARRELDSEREAAKASLVTASSVLQSEIERSSGANGSRPGALAGWQIARARAFLEENLHSNICAGGLKCRSAAKPGALLAFVQASLRRASSCLPFADRR
jgi:hypothetical protein